MNPTLDDLRGALDDAARDSYAPTDRLVGVRRAVARRRRQRALASGAAGLALVLGAGVALSQLPATSTSREVAPAASTPTVGPAAAEGIELSPYYAGGRLLASGELPGRVGATTTVEFTPASYGLALRELCEVPQGRTIALETEVNGNPVGQGSGCTGSTRAGFEQDEAYWSALGVRPGEPSTLSVTVIPVAAMGPIGDEVADADDPSLVVLLAVYEDVPVAEYPFPPRPATLEPIGGGANQIPDAAAVMTPDRRTATVTWDETLQASIAAAEPGTARLLVDGVVVGGAGFWDYEGGGAGLFLGSQTLTDAGLPAPVPGQVLTLTVEAERFAEGAWEVRVGPPA